MNLPCPETLAATWKAAAAFDAIVNFDDWYGYYTWWPKCSKGLVANGVAKQVWGLFGPPGCVLVGFSKDSALSCYNRADHSLWPGLFDGLPGQLDALIMQSGIDRQRCTFCMWWTAEQQVWSRGSVEIPPGGDDGSEEILGYITVDSRGFKLWADEYYP